MKRIVLLGALFLLAWPMVGSAESKPWGDDSGAFGPTEELGDVTSAGNLAPETRHRVLLIGTNSGSDFPGDGYTGQSVVWLLRRLGFRLTMWETESADALTLREQSLLGLDVVAPLDSAGVYDAIFLVDVSLALHGAGGHALMRDVQQMARRDSLPLYCAVLPGSYLGNGGGSNWMDGTIYSEVWQPDDASYPNPIDMTNFETGDTLRLHGRSATNQLRFQRVANESLTANGKYVTPLFWKYQTNPSATADTCLMWRYVRTDLTPNMNVVAMHAADGNTGAFLLVSQFIRDMGYNKYADYVPLVFWWMLDADGMQSTPYCGPDADRWERIAALVRQIGWTHFYFNIWPDAVDATHCETFAAAWPNIDDVFQLTLHGVNAAIVADHLWTKLAAGEPASQAAYTTSWTTLRAALTPKPDSTAIVAQVHQGEWSLDQARVFARHGNTMLPSPVIAPQASCYLQKTFVVKHSRFRPFSPLPTGTTRAATTDTSALIIAASSAADYTTYDAFYALHAPGNLQSSAGYWTGILASEIPAGQFQYNHVTSISGQNVLGECFLRACAAPFFKATDVLWEFNNSPENIRRLSVKIPTRYGM